MVVGIIIACIFASPYVAMGVYELYKLPKTIKQWRKDYQQYTFRQLKFFDPNKKIEKWHPITLPTTYHSCYAENKIPYDPHPFGNPVNPADVRLYGGGNAYR